MCIRDSPKKVVPEAKNQPNRFGSVPEAKSGPKSYEFFSMMTFHRKTFDLWSPCLKPQNERQYNDFGTFCRNWGAVFDPNLKKLEENQYWNFCPKWTLTQNFSPPKVEAFEENLL